MSRLQELMDKLEPLVDSDGLTDVILALGRVCDEKAEHLLCNWQDKRAAKAWERDARKLDRLSEQLNN